MNTTELCSNLSQTSTKEILDYCYWQSNTELIVTQGVGSIAIFSFLFLVGYVVSRLFKN